MATSKANQTFKIDLIAEIVNGWNSLTIFVKNSILNVWQGFGYASGNIPKLKQNSLPCYFYEKLQVDFRTELHCRVLSTNR